MKLDHLIFSVGSVLFILCFIGILWTLMWKFVLEPNPVIRDFFELDKQKKEKGR